MQYFCHRQRQNTPRPASNVTRPILTQHYYSYLFLWWVCKSSSGRRNCLSRRPPGIYLSETGRCRRGAALAGAPGSGPSFPIFWLIMLFLIFAFYFSSCSRRCYHFCPTILTSWTSRSSSLLPRSSGPRMSCHFCSGCSSLCPISF